MDLKKRIDEESGTFSNKSLSRNTTKECSYENNGFMQINRSIHSNSKKERASNSSYYLLDDETFDDSPKNDNLEESSSPQQNKYYQDSCIMEETEANVDSISNVKKSFTQNTAFSVKRSMNESVWMNHLKLNYIIRILII